MIFKIKLKEKKPEKINYKFLFFPKYCEYCLIGVWFQNAKYFNEDLYCPQCDKPWLWNFKSNAKKYHKPLTPPLA